LCFGVIIDTIIIVMAKILIVEDDEVLRDVYREIFDRENFLVETAADGQEGVEKIVSFMPNVVLLDIIMPKMSGFDVLKALKDNPLFKNIRIIVLTNVQLDSQDLVKSWGASYVFLKTDITPGQIVEKVKDVLKT